MICDVVHGLWSGFTEGTIKFVVSAMELLYINENRYSISGCFSFCFCLYFVYNVNLFVER